MLKTFAKVAGGIVLLTAVFAGIFRTEIAQLYHTIHLFDEDVIVHNFSNMERIAPTVRFEAAADPVLFDSNPKPLPKYFEFNGEQMLLEDFLADTSTTALVVMKGNEITFEDYYQDTGAMDKRISWSMAKSFLSALFGVAVAEGDIPDLNVPVTDYVPSLIGSGYDGVTIKNVLQMSSGVYFNEDYGDFNSDINRFGRIMALGGSFDDFAASLSSHRDQGKVMHYVSIDTHVIGMVLRAATGRTIEEYFQDKFWSKVGAESGAYYITDSEGEPMVLGGLNMIARDFARVGLVYRDRGMFNGQQIIPEQWVEDSIHADAPHLMPGRETGVGPGSFGYGYQWWIPPNPNGEFMARGIYGQYIYINREMNVVIVKNSTDRQFMDNNYLSAYQTVAAFRAIARSLADEPPVAQ